MSISIRVKIDEEKGNRFPAPSSMYVLGGSVKDYSQEQLDLVDKSKMFNYKILEKARINNLGEREVFFSANSKLQNDKEKVDKDENKSYHNNETYICGVKTSSGKKCQRDVENPEDTCWQHQI